MVVSTCTYIHVRTYTCLHVQTHKHILFLHKINTRIVQPHTRTHTHTHTHTHAHTHAHTHTHTRARTHTHTHTHTQSYTHVLTITFSFTQKANGKQLNTSVKRSNIVEEYLSLTSASKPYIWFSVRLSWFPEHENAVQRSGQCD